MPERRYDDKQVALILKRATETSAAGPGEGLTLEQHKVIAAKATPRGTGPRLSACRGMVRRCDENELLPVQPMPIAP